MPKKEAAKLVVRLLQPAAGPEWQGAEGDLVTLSRAQAKELIDGDYAVEVREAPGPDFDEQNVELSSHSAGVAKPEDPAQQQAVADVQGNAAGSAEPSGEPPADHNPDETDTSGPSKSASTK